MSQYCIYLLIIILVFESIIMLAWAISRNIIYMNLEKKYPDQIPILFPGLSNPKDLNRTYGLGKHIFKFEKMIYSKNEILMRMKRKTFLTAYISGILFYPSIILVPLTMFFCSITQV